MSRIHFISLSISCLLKDRGRASSRSAGRGGQQRLPALQLSNWDSTEIPDWSASQLCAKISVRIICEPTTIPVMPPLNSAMRCTQELWNFRIEKDKIAFAALDNTHKNRELFTPMKSSTTNGQFLRTYYFAHSE